MKKCPTCGQSVPDETEAARQAFRDRENAFHIEMCAENLESNGHKKQAEFVRVKQPGCYRTYYTRNTKTQIGYTLRFGDIEISFVMYSGKIKIKSAFKDNKRIKSLKEFDSISGLYEHLNAIESKKREKG